MTQTVASPIPRSKRAIKGAIWFMACLASAAVLVVSVSILSVQGSTPAPSPAPNGLSIVDLSIVDLKYIQFALCPSDGRCSGDSSVIIPIGKASVPNGVTVDVDEDALLEVTVDVVDADPNVPAGEGPLEIGRKMRVSAIAIDSTVNIAPLDDEWQLLAAAGDEGRWRFRVSPTEPGEYDIIISYVTEGIGKPISYKIGRDSLVPLVVNNTNVQRLNSVGEVMEVVSDKSGEIVVLSGVFIGATSKKVRKLVRKKWRKLKRRIMRSPSESSPSPTEEPHTNPSPQTPTV